LLVVLALACTTQIHAIGSRLTYQGHLTDVSQSGTATGAYDLEFILQDTAGATVGAPQVIQDTTVVDGVFTVELDFGAVAFSGAERFLRFGVRRGNETGAFTALLPRSRVTPAPYAQVSAAAEFAASVANDSIAGAQIADGSIGNADVDASLQRRVSGTCPDGQAIRIVSSTGSVTCASGLQGPAGPQGPAGSMGSTGAAGPQGPQGAAGSADAWARTGNAGTNPATNFIGTTDAQPLVLRAANVRVARFESIPLAVGSTGNVLLGSAANSIDSGVRGATLAGGGAPSNSEAGVLAEAPNRITDFYGTIGGGLANRAGDAAGTTEDAGFATVAGGHSNTAGSDYSSVGGGRSNQVDGTYSTIAGGRGNSIVGLQSSIGGGDGNSILEARGVIGGGTRNTVSGDRGTVGGGDLNTAGALGSTVAGGSRNDATGGYSTVAGGVQNAAIALGSTAGGGRHNCAGGRDSWAAGNFALVRVPDGLTFPQFHGCQGVPDSNDADGDEGSFVWADSREVPFTSTGPDQFNIRALGGLRLSADTSQFFGATGRQMLNLFNDDYGIGVQTSTMYFRSNARYAWYSGGSHASSSLDPGTGGALLMTLGTNSGTPTGTARAQLFTSVSDRNVKTGFESIDTVDILAGVLALPLSEWSYRNATDERHIGPMAQDFRAAFGLGSDDTSIATIDADGIALAAIQGLNARLEGEIAKRDAELAALRAELASLRYALRSGSR